MGNHCNKTRHSAAFAGVGGVLLQQEGLILQGLLGRRGGNFLLGDQLEAGAQIRKLSSLTCSLWPARPGWLFAGCWATPRLPAVLGTQHPAGAVARAAVGGGQSGSRAAQGSRTPATAPTPLRWRHRAHFTAGPPACLRQMVGFESARICRQDQAGPTPAKPGS